MDRFWSLEIFSWLFHLGQKYPLQWERNKKQASIFYDPSAQHSHLIQHQHSLLLKLFTLSCSILSAHQRCNVITDTTRFFCMFMSADQITLMWGGTFSSLQLCSHTMYPPCYLSPALVFQTELDITVIFLCSNVFFFAWYEVNLKGEGGGRRKKWDHSPLKMVTLANWWQNTSLQMIF